MPGFGLPRMRKSSMSWSPAEGDYGDGTCDVQSDSEKADFSHC